MTPSWPFVFTTTVTPPETVVLLTPAMKVLFCTRLVPIRITPDSLATPLLPISMLLLPVVSDPASWPSAILPLPVVLAESAESPMAVLPLPVVLS
jgi:hypothetical protein